MRRGDLLFRLAVFVAVVALVVAAATTVFAPPDDTTPVPDDPPPEHPAYAADRLTIDRIPAEGSVTDRLPDNESEEKVVLIDAAHQNRVDREDLQPLVEALVRRGHEIRFLTADEDIDSDLEAADAFVVADPGAPFSGAQVDQVDGFVNDGGRLLLLGEPNRQSISLGLFGASVSTERSRVTALAGRFGISFGTRYLQNMDHNDGSFRNVVVEPAPGAEIQGVDRATTYVAAPVTTGEGETLLRTAPGTNVSGQDASGRFPVAVTDGSGNVLAIGDASLFAERHVSIADNEAVAAHAVEFLVSGDKRDGTPTNETPTDGGTPGLRDDGPSGPTPTPPSGPSTPGPTATPTPTSTPTATDEG
jgi:hypothetical protein